MKIPRTRKAAIRQSMESKNVEDAVELAYDLGRIAGLREIISANWTHLEPYRWAMERLAKLEAVLRKLP